MVKPFIEAKTFKKVKFVYSDNPQSRRIMEELFDMDKLDSAFGGKNPAGFNYETSAQLMREDDKKKLSDSVSNSSLPTYLSPAESEINQEDASISDPDSEASEEGGFSPSHEMASLNLEEGANKAAVLLPAGNDPGHSQSEAAKEVYLKDPA